MTEYKFGELARIRYGNTAAFFPEVNPGTEMGFTVTQEELIEEKLARLKWVQSKPNKNRNVYFGSILVCTKQGESILQKDLLKLVLLLAQQEVYTYSDEFYNLVKRLSKEELPALLTHTKSPVRQAARERMEELNSINLPTPNR